MTRVLEVRRGLATAKHGTTPLAIADIWSLVSARFQAIHEDVARGA